MAELEALLASSSASSKPASSHFAAVAPIQAEPSEPHIIEVDEFEAEVREAWHSWS